MKRTMIGFTVCLIVGISTVCEAARSRPTPTPEPSPTVTPIPESVIVEPSMPMIAESAPATDQPSSQYHYGIGYEAGINSVTGQNALVLGWWADRFGLDCLVGFSKGETRVSEKITESRNSLAQPNMTRVTEYAITGNPPTTPYIITAGLVPKLKVFRSRWIHIYGGLLGAINFSLDDDYKTGTVTETINSIDYPTNKHIEEANYGKVTVERDPEFILGPKLGSEVFLKWFPNVAIGFAAGIFAIFGGDTTSTFELSESKIYDVAAGVSQPPTTSKTKKVIESEGKGLRGSTFGFAGTNFKFTGIFTVRYIW